MGNSKNKRFLIKVFGLVGSLLLSNHASALVILQNASTSVGADYDNNISMTKNAQSIWRYTVVPSYTLNSVNELNRWYTKASLNIQRSSDKNLSVDREDPTVGIGWERELARGRFSLTGNYRRASTRVTELEDSGLVSRDATSVSRSVSANWSRYLTERLSWSLGGGYSKSTFSGGGGFSGFSSNSLNTSISYEWSERLRPFINLGYSTYSPEVSNQDTTKSQTFTVGTNYILTPRLNLSASGGLTRIETGVGKVGNLTLSYIGEQYQLSGTYSRAVTPSSIGGFQNADSISLNYGYSLSEKSNLGTSFSYRKNNSLNDIESKQLSAFYSRNLTEYWQMRLSLQMREIKSTSQSANGEAIGVSLIYNTPEF